MSGVEALSRMASRLAWGLALALAACTPEPEPVRWEGVDIEALREAFAGPTASLDAVSDALADRSTHERLVRHDPIVRALASYLGAVLLGLGDPLEPGPESVWAFADGLEGTHVFVLVACPGPRLRQPDAQPDAQPEPPFAHGMMQIDAPTLAANVTSTTALEGQLRLSFRACTLGPFELDGHVDAYRAVDVDELGLIPQLRIRSLASARAATLALDSPLRLDHEQISALLSVNGGQTLVVRRRFASEGLELRARDGSLTCTIVARSLTCTP